MKIGVWPRVKLLRLTLTDSFHLCADDQSSYSDLWKRIVEHPDEPVDELDCSNVTDTTPDVCGNLGDDVFSEVPKLVSNEKIIDDEKSVVIDDLTLSSPDPHTSKTSFSPMTQMKDSHDQIESTVCNSKLSLDFIHDQIVVENFVQVQNNTSDDQSYANSATPSILCSPETLKKHSDNQKQCFVDNSSLLITNDFYDQSINGNLNKMRKICADEQRQAIVLDKSTLSSSNNSSKLVDDFGGKQNSTSLASFSINVKQTDNSVALLSAGESDNPPDKNVLKDKPAKNSDEKTHGFLNDSMAFLPDPEHVQCRDSIQIQENNFGYDQQDVSIKDILVVFNGVDANENPSNVCKKDIVDENISDINNENIETDTKPTTTPITKTNHLKNGGLPKYLKLFDRRRKQKQQDISVKSKPNISKIKLENGIEHNIDSNRFLEEVISGSSNSPETSILSQPADETRIQSQPEDRTNIQSQPEYETNIQSQPEDETNIQLQPVDVHVREQELIHFEPGFYNHKQKNQFIQLKPSEILNNVCNNNIHRYDLREKSISSSGTDDNDNFSDNDAVTNVNVTKEYVSSCHDNDVYNNNDNVIYYNGESMDSDREVTESSDDFTDDDFTDDNSSICDYDGDNYVTNQEDDVIDNDVITHDNDNSIDEYNVTDDDEYVVTDDDDDVIGDQQHSENWNQELFMYKLHQAYFQHINTLYYYKNLYYDM